MANHSYPVVFYVIINTEYLLHMVDDNLSMGPSGQPNGLVPLGTAKAWVRIPIPTYVTCCVKNKKN